MTDLGHLADDSVIGRIYSRFHGPYPRARIRVLWTRRVFSREGKFPASDALSREVSAARWPFIVGGRGAPDQRRGYSGSIDFQTSTRATVAQQEGGVCFDGLRHRAGFTMSRMGAWLRPIEGGLRPGATLIATERTKAQRSSSAVSISGHRRRSGPGRAEDSRLTQPSRAVLGERCLPGIGCRLVARGVCRRRAERGGGGGSPSL